jgi:hypothetical protein
MILSIADVLTPSIQPHRLASHDLSYLTEIWIPTIPFRVRCTQNLADMAVNQSARDRQQLVWHIRENALRDFQLPTFD